MDWMEQTFTQGFGTNSFMHDSLDMDNQVSRPVSDRFTLHEEHVARTAQT